MPLKKNKNIWCNNSKTSYFSFYHGHVDNYTRQAFFNMFSVKKIRFLQTPSYLGFVVDAPLVSACRIAPAKGPPRFLKFLDGCYTIIALEKCSEKCCRFVVQTFQTHFSCI